MSGIRLLSLVVSVAVLSGFGPSRSWADDGADDAPPTYSLGLVARPLDAPLRAQTNLSDDRGLLVDSVTVDGPADKAGVEQYDVLIAVDDHEVGTADAVDDAWEAIWYAAMLGSSVAKTKISRFALILKILPLRSPT